MKWVFATLFPLVAAFLLSAYVTYHRPLFTRAAAPASLQFNGTNQYARGTNLPLLTTFTVEAWVRRTVDNNGYQTFVSDANNSYAQGMFVLFVDGSGAECGPGDQFAYWQAAGNSTQCSGVTANLNTWYHVAVVRDAAGTRRMYVNGVLTSTQLNTPAPTDSSGRLTLGRSGDYNGEYFAGNIDAVRISNTVRYSVNFAPPTTAFSADTNAVVIYNIDAGAGQTVADTSGNNRNALLGGSTTVQTSDPVWVTLSPVDSGGSQPTPTPTNPPVGGPTATPTPTVGLTPTATPILPTNTPTPVVPTATPTVTPTPLPPGSNTVLRFYGNGTNDIDRVKIPVDNPQTASDVGATDFTIEWWMRIPQGATNTGTLSCGTSVNDGWITGNVIIDRDIWGAGDLGDFGVAYGAGRLAFGVNNGSTGSTLCSSVSVNLGDGNWHHVAVSRRRSDGQLSMFVDGILSAQSTGPAGDISYRNGRSTTFTDDPFLVFGAEKHDAGSAYPSYNGEFDEVRISNTLRYTGNFLRPSAPFTSDSNTMALYHFNEGSGTVAVDAAGNVNGTLRIGGVPQGPVYQTAVTPFAP